MAITTSNSAAVEIARRDLGIPSALALSVLDDRATNTGKWVTGGVAPLDWNDSDVVDPNYPTKYAFDRRPWTTTRPLGASIDTNQYVALIFHLTPGSDAAHTIDTVAAQLLNTFSTLTLRVRVAAMADFSDQILVASFNASDTTAKFISVGLGAGNDDQYTGVEYVSFEFDKSGGFSTTAPQLGSAWAGKRRQFTHQPEQTGYDDKPLSSLTTPFEADSGASVEYVKHKGRAIIPANRMLTPDGSAGFDGVQLVRDFFEDTDYGTKHFLYIDEPTASPIAKGHWMKLEDPSLALPLGGPSDRMWESTFAEIPPFQSWET